VRTSFAENDLTLGDYIEPEGPVSERDPEIVLAFPVTTPTPEDVQGIVWIFPTSDDGRRFEDYSEDRRAAAGPGGCLLGDCALGRSEPAGDQILREGNVVVWNNAGSPDQLSDVKAALSALSGADG